MQLSRARRFTGDGYAPEGAIQSPAWAYFLSTGFARNAPATLCRAIKHRCTTAKERRIMRWEHEHILEAVQRQALAQRTWIFGSPSRRSILPMRRSNSIGLMS